VGALLKRTVRVSFFFGVEKLAVTLKKNILCKSQSPSHPRVTAERYEPSARARPS